MRNQDNHLVPPDAVRDHVTGSANCSAIETTAASRVPSATDGAPRRALLAGQLMVVESTTAVGMLIGGVVIAGLGVQPTLVAAGVVLMVAAVVGTGSRAPDAD
ncbi:hypothetical protein ABLG96_21010 [Nakamurella sp. A5-74]|uniref:MFS transporter n=1 Tax=Nakamurella sp. A5-74 TaxID=3158264 RepID=A0AAU8DMY2_9ACTN